MVIELCDTDIIWRNARLATMDPAVNAAYGLLKEYDLVVRDDKILAILPTATLQTSRCQVIDVQQRLITPGLIDCHTHLVFGGNRAYEWEQRLNGMSYAELSAQGGGLMRQFLRLGPVLMSNLSVPRNNDLLHLWPKV